MAKGNPIMPYQPTKLTEAKRTANLLMQAVDRSVEQRLRRIQREHELVWHGKEATAQEVFDAMGDLAKDYLAFTKQDVKGLETALAKLGKTFADYIDPTDIEDHCPVDPKANGTVEVQCPP